MAKERPGLYAMIAVAAILTISSNVRIRKIESRVQVLDNRTHEIQNMLPNLQSKVESFPMLKQENVIGTPAIDKFYEIGTNRVYLEIDGKPVESYFTNQSTIKLER